MRRSRSTKIICIETLKEVLENAPGAQYGLCDRINAALTRRGKAKLRGNDLFPYFRRWPEFSGHDIYPVPCSVEEMGRLMLINGNPPTIHYTLDTPAGLAEAAFSQTLCYTPAAKQRYTGEYGEARLRLAAFLLAELEKELETDHEQAQEQEQGR